MKETPTSPTLQVRLLGDFSLTYRDATVMAASRAHNERWWDAELHRLRGELLLAGGADSNDAEAAYRRAIEVARSQQARALELRAATSLVRLSSGQGAAGEARDLHFLCIDPLRPWWAEGP